MLSRIRGRVTYANVAMTLALVFATTGGAFAAAGKHHSGKGRKRGKPVLITSTKQISKGVLAALKGNAGPAGPAGAQGATGTAGKDGANGESVSVAMLLTSNPGCSKLGGAEFKVGSGTPAFACNGKEGKQGTAGESVSVMGLSANNGSGDCEEGGAEFRVGSGTPAFACNGSPWAAGGTLPAGQSEKGVWSAAGMPVESGGLFFVVAPFSFTIPLRGELPFLRTHVIKVGKGAGGGTCPTTSSTENPEAEPGNLCIFVGTEENVKSSFPSYLPNNPATGNLGSGATGNGLKILAEEGTKAVIAQGTWAVTAPDPAVTSLSVSKGPAAGGTVVTIKGTNLDGEASVHFGTEEATNIEVESATEINATSPQGSGTVDVTVTIGGYTSVASAADHYTYE